MKRITLAFATILVALMLTAGAFVPSKDTAQAAVLDPPPQKEIVVTIVDKKNRPMKLESLPRESQAQVERVKRSARTLLDSGSSGPNEKLKVSIECTYPPLKCKLIIEF